MEDGDRRRDRTDRLRQDLLLAVVLFSGDVLLAVLTPREYRPYPLADALPWLAVSYVAVVLRRTAVWVAVGLLAVHLLVSATLLPTLPAGGIALVVLTYTIAASTPIQRAILTTLLLWLPPVMLFSVTGNYQGPPLRLPLVYFVLSQVATVLVCFFIGRTVYNRRAYIAALEDRAHTAERNQQSVAEQAVADERRRIARELHDVVAHHVSVMGVLATASRRTLRNDPAAADEVLATIEDTGRVALREMRRLLSVLRTDAEPAGELEPQPGLPGLEPLLEQIREAGLPVSLFVSGEPGKLDPGVALAVYRITQEALTNALKHAGPASAEVRLTFTAKELAIDISDTGRGPHPGDHHIGHGVLGMRERISLYGGTLRTGPRPGGGFRVAARIPLEPSAECSEGDRPAVAPVLLQPTEEGRVA